MATVRVRVTPKSAVDAVGGLRDDEVLVRVRQAPESGRANAAVCRTVAEFLGIPKSSVSVMRGETGRNKVLNVEGMTAEQVVEALRAAFPGVDPSVSVR